MITLLSDDPVEQSLLRAIYETWGDPAPVLIYADWLDEQPSDELPLRARFLRRHWSPRQPAEDRESDASDPIEARDAWYSARLRCREKGVYLATSSIMPLLEFSQVNDWRAAAQRDSFGDDPIAVRFLRADDVDVIRLILAPYASQIRVLHLSYTHCGAVGAAHLAVCRNFEKLWRLDLSRVVSVDPPTFRPRLGRPESGMGDEGVFALSRGRGLASLRSLVLMDNGITARGAIELAKTQAFPNLKFLDLRGNPLGDAGRAACDELRSRGVAVCDSA